MDIVDLAVAGIPATLFVVACVEGLKRLLKVSGDAAIALALAVGVAVAVACHLAELVPAFGDWWETVAVGLVLGLSACGLFDLGQAVKARV